MTGQTPSLDATLADVVATAAKPLSQAMTLPKEAYNDPAFFAVEQKKAMEAGWICLAHVSQVKTPGSFIAVDLFDEPLLVYEKQAIIRGTLEIPASAAGKEEALELNIKYQACNDQTCIRPTTVSLKGKFKVAASGEAVRQVNQKWFKTESGN